MWVLYLSDIMVLFVYTMILDWQCDLRKIGLIYIMFGNILLIEKSETNLRIILYNS